MQMQTARTPEYPLVKGGSATAGTIDLVLAGLDQLRRESGNAQSDLGVLLTYATPEKFGLPLPLESDSLEFLQGKGIVDASGKIASQSIAMVLASAIHLTEGEYMVFAPNA